MNSFKYHSIGLLSALAIFVNCNAQGILDSEPDKSKWVDLRLGLIGDTQGKSSEFPAYSFGVGGNFTTEKLLFTVRVNFNREGKFLVADAAPSTHFCDAGILLGKYFSQADTKRIISLSIGVGMILGRRYTSTILGSGLISTGGIHMYEGKSISTIGIPMEARIMWGNKKPKWGFAAFTNINSEVPYFGGALVIPIISI